MANSPSYVPQTNETNPVKQNVAIQQLHTAVSDAAAAAAAAVQTSRVVAAGTGLTGGGDLSADRTIALATPVALANGGTGAGSAASARANLGAAAQPQLDFIAGTIKAPANQRYYTPVWFPYAGTLNGLVAMTEAGTCTVTVTIQGTAVTGGVMNVNTGLQSISFTGANSFAAGNFVSLDVSAVASAASLDFVLYFTRTLA